MNPSTQPGLPKHLLAVSQTLSLALMVLACPVYAQETAPAGDITGVGNFAHIVEDMDESLRFYRDVLGLEVTVSADFSVNAGVQDMGGTPNAESRIAVLDVPGTELDIELIEYRGIDRNHQQPHFVDPGAANMAMRPRDLDSLFPAVRDFPGVNVLTTSGEPVTITTPNGTLHAVFVQDPDGFVVEMLGNPGGEELISANSFELTVADTDESIRFYNDLLGFNFTKGEGFVDNPDMANTAGAPGASFLQSRAIIPGTNIPMILIEFKDIARKTLSGRTQDPGTTVLQLEVQDVDALTAKLTAAGASIVSKDGKPAEPFPGLKIVIVRDPNNMLLELVERAAR